MLHIQTHRYKYLASVENSQDSHTAISDEQANENDKKNQNKQIQFYVNEGSNSKDPCRLNENA